MDFCTFFADTDVEVTESIDNESFENNSQTHAQNGLTLAVLSEYTIMFVFGLIFLAFICLCLCGFVIYTAQKRKREQTQDIMGSTVEMGEGMKTETLACEGKGHNMNRVNSTSYITASDVNLLGNHETNQMNVVTVASVESITPMAPDDVTPNGNDNGGIYMPTLPSLPAAPIDNTEMNESESEDEAMLRRLCKL